MSQNPEDPVRFLVSAATSRSSLISIEHAELLSSTIVIRYDKKNLLGRLVEMEVELIFVENVLQRLYFKCTI